MELNELAGKILIIDDSPANLRLLSQILIEHGYQVRAVTNGPRALESMKVDRPDLVLLDIRMPGMDGFEVCQQIKENAQSRDVPVLFISALDEIHDKMKAFSVGGLDYITKPFQMEEVLARVRTHLLLWRLQNNLKEANQRMQRELILAAQVQSSIMRKQPSNPPGWQISVKVIPAKLTCGDFLDVIYLPDGRVALLIADVVDKGVGAALFMAMSCALLRTYVHEHPANPERVFQAVNQRILEDTETEQYVTVFLAMMNLESGELIYANAGHNPPIFVHDDANETIESLERTGMALGVLEDVSWEQRGVQLSPGDTLVLYTDGITDAENPNHEFYGYDRLLKSIQENKGIKAEELQKSILDSVFGFTQEASQSDDIAMIVLIREQTVVFDNRTK